MKITEITNEAIIFDNGTRITYDHEQDCCEDNYADFEQIDDVCRKTEFNEPLDFEAVDGSGFRFGNKPLNMFFVPCYSDQTGYYTDEIDIYVNDVKVLTFSAEERIY